MSIRIRALINIGIIAILSGIGSVLVLWILAHRSIAQISQESHVGFEIIEKQDCIQNTQRAINALHERLLFLGDKTADWSHWDDTWFFARHPNDAYRTSNLNISTLENLQISSLSIFNAHGNLLERKAKIHPASLDSLVQPFLFRSLAHDSIPEKVLGFAKADEHIFFISLQPIVHSNGAGPVAGSILFTQIVDSIFLQQLQQATKLKISIHALDTIYTQPSLRIQSADTMQGLQSLIGIDGKPLGNIKISLPRNIFQHELHTLARIRNSEKQLILWIVICSLFSFSIFLIAISINFNRKVLSRILRLSTAAQDIGQEGSLTTFVPEDGSDEIGSLARSINTMIKGLQHSSETIARRNSEMDMLLTHIPIGLCSLDHSLHINPEHSRSLHTFLGRPQLVGLSFPDLLSTAISDPNKHSELQQFLEFALEGIMSNADLNGLNPVPELAIGNTKHGKRWLKFQYHPIPHNEGTQLLVMIQDITEEKNLATEIARSNREILQLKAIVENPNLYRDFLVEVAKLVDFIVENCNNLESSEDAQFIAGDFFRKAHTIKGVALSFGSQSLASAAKVLEAALACYQEQKSPSEEWFDQFRTAVASLDAAMTELRCNARRILGDDTETTGQQLHISLKHLKGLAKTIHSLNIPYPYNFQVEEAVWQLQLIPAEKGLARTTRIVPDLIERIGKRIRFQLIGADCLIHCETAFQLNSLLIHLLRNAFDHGIEEEAIRQRNNKPLIGSVRLSVQRSDRTLTISLSDDGQGLDLEKIKQTAIQKNFITPEFASGIDEEEIAQLILLAGLSTKDELSEVSGRGVGMDAVMDILRHQLHGDLQIKSQQGKGTTFTLVIPMPF